MIGVGIAVTVIGIVFIFVVPWLGITLTIVGLVLFIAFVAGFGRRTTREPGR